MNTTFRYDQAYTPPAPVLEVTLVSSAEGLRTSPLSAIVDSGADATLVPLAYLNEINAPVTVEMTARSQWGERRRVLLYLVDLEIAGLVLPGIEVVGDDYGSELLLGRNALNKLRLLLDGSALTSEIRS